MFYHLTDSPLEETAAQLLGRALSSGWHVMVRGTDAARLEWLDTRLWTHPEDGFLPHGVAGGPQDAEHPVLLGLGPIANSAKGLMAVDGAAVSLDETKGLERVWILFDGNDEGAVAAARVQWKALTEAGVAAQYWSEASGRWEKKAG